MNSSLASSVLLQTAIGFLALLALAGSSMAHTFVVTKLEDDNGACTPDDCSVREAIIAANALPGPDRVELRTGVHVLSIPGPDPVAMSVPESGDLDILDDLELTGDPNGTTVILGNADDRVIEVAFTTVLFSAIEFTGGRDLLDSGGCVRLFRANATIVDCYITECFCENGDGGGLVEASSSVTMINTTVSNNVSNQVGGGIAQLGGAPPSRFEIINSTISGNRSLLPGGGFFHSGGSTLIRHSTIANNEAPFGDAIFSLSRISVQNSILEGKCTGLLPFSLGRNLAGPDLDDNCLLGTFLPDDLVFEQLGLGPLADNGGPTLTHALVPGSPAIDAANPDHCEATDQRGVTRPQGSECDIGAFEAFPMAPQIPTLSSVGIVAMACLLLTAALAVLRRGLGGKGSDRSSKPCLPLRA